MADNKKIASDVLAAVGGAANISDVTHCTTRLRFTLKDQNIPVDDEVKKIPGVLGVVRSRKSVALAALPPMPPSTKIWTHPKRS